MQAVKKLTDGAAKRYNKHILRSGNGNEQRMSDTEIVTLRRVVKGCAVWGCGVMRIRVEEVDLEKPMENMTSDRYVIQGKTTIAWMIGEEIKRRFSREVKDYIFPEFFFDSLVAEWRWVRADTWKFVVGWEGSNKAGRVSASMKSQSWQVGHVEEVRVQGLWLVKGVLQKTAPGLVEAGEPEAEIASLNPTETSQISLGSGAFTRPSHHKSILSDLQGLNLSEQYFSSDG